jgi:hypothetical protein
LVAAAAGAAGHGALLLSSANAPSLGGLVHAFGDSAEPISFDLAVGGLGLDGENESIALTPARLVWLAASESAFSVNASDAGDLTVLEQAKSLPGNIYDIHSVDTNGSSFLLGQVNETLDGGMTGAIVTTDGKSAPTPYIAPTDGSLADFAVYAGPYVAWLRGIGWHESWLYTSVEIWASPYDSDPAKLAPFKVADYPFTWMNPLLGAGGRIAYFQDESTMAVWDLATLTQTLYTPPPDQGVAPTDMGITSTHLWVNTAKIPANMNPTDMIVRFALP